STRSITPSVSIGSGSVPAGRMRSVAARTAACRCATVGLRASASATNDGRVESPTTDTGEPCPNAGLAPAITSELAARISCRTCIPLLVPFQLDSPNLPMTWSDSWNGTHQSVSGGTRRSPRRSRRRVGAHYAWERLGLGRWRERCLWVGGGEVRDPETDNVGLSCGGGNGSTKRDHCGRCDRAERRIGARGHVCHRTDGRPRPVGGHLLLAARGRSSFDLVTQQR